MGKINLSKVPVLKGSKYPAPFDAQFADRGTQYVGDAGGITQYGANITHLPPGATSSLRHWHVNEDEFVMVTEGEVTLVEDDGETPMQVGDCAAFPAGVENGHHFINKTDKIAKFLVIGTRLPDETGYYSDVDMKVTIKNREFSFTRKDGSPLPEGDN